METEHNLIRLSLSQASNQVIETHLKKTALEIAVTTNATANKINPTY
jgi:hypothetical protein